MFSHILIFSATYQYVDTVGTTTFWPWLHARKAIPFYMNVTTLCWCFHLCWESWTLCVQTVFPTAGWDSSHPRRARPAQKNRKGTVAWDGFFYYFARIMIFFRFWTGIGWYLDVDSFHWRIWREIWEYFDVKYIHKKCVGKYKEKKYSYISIKTD